MKEIPLNSLNIAGAAAGRALPSNTPDWVETLHFTFAKGPEEKLVLDGGEKLGPVTLACGTYGKLNAQKSNAILICHALSGDAHAAGYSAGIRKSGWWDTSIGPGKAFDTASLSSVPT